MDRWYNKSAEAAGCWKNNVYSGKDNGDSETQIQVFRIIQCVHSLQSWKIPEVTLIAIGTSARGRGGVHHHQTGE